MVVVGTAHEERYDCMVASSLRGSSDHQEKFHRVATDEHDLVGLLFCLDAALRVALSTDSLTSRPDRRLTCKVGRI